MKKSIIAAGILLAAISTAATAQGKYPHDGKHLPPAAAAPTPQKPTYWTSYFDTMYDDTMDVTACANARNTDEFSRDGWEKHHNPKDKPSK